MNTASKLTLAALALTVLGTAAAQAQVNNASITATATVQTPISSEFQSHVANSVSWNRYLTCSSVGHSLNQNGILVTL